MRLEPLGDQAVLAYCADETEAARLAAQVRAALPGWCIDVVQAYSSVAVYYDLHAVDFARASDWLASLEASPSSASAPGRLPCDPVLL